MSVHIKRNLVAHCNRGSADKIYMACVRNAKNASGETVWQTLGKWGRRGKHLSVQVKLTTHSEDAARAEQQNLFRDKCSEGYVDIESSAYHGSCRMSDSYIRDNLEGDSVAVRADAEKEDEPDVLKIEVIKSWEKPAPSPPDEPEESEMVCRDNSGMVEQFDEGVTYVCERHADKTMLWVYDKFGEKREVFRERFKKAS